MTPELASEIERLQRIANVVTATRLVARYVAARSPFDPEPGTRVRVETTDLAPIRVVGELHGSSVSVSILLGEDSSSRRVPTADPVLLGYEMALVDRAATELLAYHWHPASKVSPMVDPHVHVSASLQPTRADGSRGAYPLDKLHLPTSHVPLAAFVRMLVEEFGVAPRAIDWRVRLGPSQAI